MARRASYRWLICIVEVATLDSLLDVGAKELDELVADL